MLDDININSKFFPYICNLRGDLLLILNIFLYLSLKRKY